MGLLFLLFIAGWNGPNLIDTGRVAERAETRPNRPVPSPSRRRDGIKILNGKISKYISNGLENKGGLEPFIFGTESTIFLFF
jgi:hypothetical protein